MTAPAPLELHLPFGAGRRRVRVLVPPTPKRPDPAPPPVLVLFDGQNVLDDHGSFAGGWHAHEAVAKLPGTVRRPVLVAVDHGGSARNRELWRDLDPLLAFVGEQVLPAVRARLDVATDPVDTAVGGASMGGLASFAAVMRRPETFGTALCLSPSFWVEGWRVFDELDRRGLPPGARVYLDVGLREGSAMAPGARRMAAELAARLPSDDHVFRPDRRGRHHERDWRRRMPGALRFAFRRR